MWIPVSRIIVNEQKLNEDKLDDLIDYISRGRKIKPITIRKTDGWHKPHSKDEHCKYCSIKGPGDIYHVVDGHHRLEAYKQLGKEMIEVMVTL